MKKLINLFLPVLASALLLNSPVHAAKTVTYYHHDALGSPVALTDENGNVKCNEDYMPYGERVRKEAGCEENNIWYTGKPEEPDLGLQYFGARWYDPSIGRFTGIDPVKFQEGNIHSFNAYKYANNNPYKYIDPDGRLETHAEDDAFLGSGNATVKVDQLEIAIKYAELASSGGFGALKGLATKLFFKSGAKGGAAKTGVQANRVQGKVGEAITEATLKKNGNFAGKQVTIETSTGKRSVIDFVTNSKGGKGVIETKTGGAKLTSGQRQLFDDVQNGRPVIPRGQNAANAGLTPGRPTVIKSCGIDRPC